MEVNEKCDVYNFRMLTLEVIMGNHPRVFYFAELAYTIEVNEKCDVYNFRMLTLEVIMGNHPEDLVSFLSSSSSSSSSAMTSTTQLKDILDQCLKSPRNQVALKVVLIAKLALACLATNPKSRPTKQEVSKRLSIEKAPTLEAVDILTFGLRFKNA